MAVDYFINPGILYMTLALGATLVCRLTALVTMTWMLAVVVSAWSAHLVRIVMDVCHALATSTLISAPRHKITRV